MLKNALKTALRLTALTAAFPLAAAAGFGRFKTTYTLAAQALALVPGIAGDYLRIAFYCYTLRECSFSSRVSFGSFFAHPEAQIGASVYIGSYCIIGTASIGARTQIASGVQILSGRHQHARSAGGEISGAEKGVFTALNIGADCWIGAGAIVMADIGTGATVGAGAVVPRSIPAHSIAVGNPAQVVKAAIQNISSS